jgi:hypothetical protein
LMDVRPVSIHCSLGEHSLASNHGYHPECPAGLGIPRFLLHH